MRKVYILTLMVVTSLIFAQKKNVNIAWRALTDYQSTLNDKPNFEYLQKAKDHIDLALQNPETKDDSKTLTYYTQIYLELFKYYQNNPDANVDKYSYFNEAVRTYTILKDKYPKIITTPEFQNLGITLLNISNQESVKLYNDKKYRDAANMFLSAHAMQKIILNKNDTSTLFNALVSAYKDNSKEKASEIGNEMISNNMANEKVYQLLYSMHMKNKDTLNALSVLKKGREQFPTNMDLINFETDYFIHTKRYPDAIKNLEYIVHKDTTNALLLLTLANLYDNLANQNMNAKNYSDSTEQLFNNAINNYLKSYKYKNQLDNDNLYTLNYNIGAYYTNYGLFYYNKKMKELKITDLSQKQKEVEEQRKKYTQMGLPYLKDAEALKPNDNTVITALYRVYAIIGDTKNAEVYKNKMLGK